MFDKFGNAHNPEVSGSGAHIGGSNSNIHTNDISNDSELLIASGNCNDSSACGRDEVGDNTSVLNTNRLGKLEKNKTLMRINTLGLIDLNKLLLIFCVGLILFVGNCWAGYACLSNPCLFGVCIDDLNR